MFACILFKNVNLFSPRPVLRGRRAVVNKITGSTVQVYSDWTTVWKYICSTTNPSIVCALQLCIGSVKLYDSVQLCTKCVQWLSISVHCNSTSCGQYICIWIYIYIYIKCVCMSQGKKQNSVKNKLEKIFRGKKRAMGLSGVRKGDLKFLPC